MSKGLRLAALLWVRKLAAAVHDRRNSGSLMRHLLLLAALVFAGTGRAADSFDVTIDVDAVRQGRH